MTDVLHTAGEFAPALPISLNDISVTAPTSSAVEHSPQLLDDASGAASHEEATDEEASDAPNAFAALGLAPELVAACKDLGYTQPTQVQIKAVPLAMGALHDGQTEGSKAAKFVDLMVSSQTGSGKTAAFLLPVLHTLLAQQATAEAQERAEYEVAVASALAKGEPAPKRNKRKDPTNPRNFKAATPGALVLCPTRELAQQVAHDAIELVKHCRGLRIANIVGGMPYQLQIAKLQNANLVVATPGRLLDLQRSMQIKLDQVQFLVVDEADRMLDLGFSDDLAEVNQLTEKRKQTMMFSATFAPRIQQLAARVMREPQRITIDSPQEKHANIQQILFWADNAQHKRKLLDHWLRDTNINQAIVFASTQVECDGLANDLQQDGFSAVALHGALSQGLRNRRLMALRQGQVQILVATDVAARGIDVPTISHVFNFGLPMKAEDYTHRIGRTGRAGRDGLAVTFAEFRDRRKIFDIEAYSQQPLKAQTLPGLEPQQRFPQERASFGNRSRSNESHSRDRKFGGPREPSSYVRKGGFNDRFASERGNDRFANDRGGERGNERPGSDRFSHDRGAHDPRFSAGRPAGFEARGPRADARPPRGDFHAPRGEFPARGDFAPRGDFAGRKPAGKPFGKPAGAPGGAGAYGAGKPAAPRGDKVFVPRDAKKRTARFGD